MNREEILMQAKKCVCGDRELDYGSPEDNFGMIALLWSTYTGHNLTSKDVAMMMRLLKIARIKTGKSADSFVDLAGYAACAGEISQGDNLSRIAIAPGAIIEIPVEIAGDPEKIDEYIKQLKGKER